MLAAEANVATGCGTRVRYKVLAHIKVAYQPKSLKKKTGERLKWWVRKTLCRTLVQGIVRAAGYGVRRSANI